MTDRAQERDLMSDGGLVRMVAVVDFSSPCAN